MWGGGIVEGVVGFGVVRRRCWFGLNMHRVGVERDGLTDAVGGEEVHWGESDGEMGAEEMCLWGASVERGHSEGVRGGGEG